MSRSNPSENTPHPCTRWFQWNGEKGNIRYYDKQNKTNIEVELPFKFILLDQVAAVSGWSDKMNSGIYSSEVKDTRSEPLTVKYFKGGEVAKGLYADIKDTIVDAGGHFVLNCYIAYWVGPGDADGGSGLLNLGSLQFKGAALSAWMDFEKKNHKETWKQAITITGYKEGQKGRVIFRVPEFAITSLEKEDDDSATELDRTLQQYLKDYFRRGKVELPPEIQEDPPEEDDSIPF